MVFLRCLIVLSFWLPSLGYGRTVKRDKAKGEVNSLELAIRCFYRDYGFMPAAETSIGSRDAIRALIAEDPERNPRQTVYLELESSDLDGTYLDPWGQQYAVYLDHDLDGRITLYREEFAATAIAHSAGADRKFGTYDDVFSGVSPRHLAPAPLRVRLKKLFILSIQLVALVGLFAAVIYAVRTQPKEKRQPERLP